MKDGIAAHPTTPLDGVSEVAELIFDRFEQMEFAFAEAQEATRSATQSLEQAAAGLDRAVAQGDALRRIEATLARVEAKVDRLSNRDTADYQTHLEGFAATLERVVEQTETTADTGHLVTAIRDLSHTNRHLAAGTVGPDVMDVHEAFLNDLRLAVAECLAQVLKSHPQEVQRLNAP